MAYHQEAPNVAPRLEVVAEHGEHGDQLYGRCTMHHLMRPVTLHCKITTVDGFSGQHSVSGHLLVSYQVKRLLDLDFIPLMQPVLTTKREKNYHVNLL